jgi:hypothetical protein
LAVWAAAGDASAAARAVARAVVKRNIFMDVVSFLASPALGKCDFCVDLAKHKFVN